FQCYLSVFKYNKRELEVGKRGAQIGTYSVSKTFQYRENVAIMDLLNRVAAPVTFFAVPCFAFYAFYSNCPKSNGTKFIRFLAAQIHFSSILTVMMCFLRSEPKFRKAIRKYREIDWIFSRFGLFEVDLSTVKVSPQESNIYFSMLSRDL
ncbi:hypothetical protein PMAYCL1PPCAC_27630, partial [Pristionchus mayeri]